MAVVAVLMTGEATFYEKYIEDGVWKGVGLGEPG